MKSHEIKVSESFFFSDDDMENIVITALEGGIGYWACLDNTGDEWKDLPKETPISVWAWKILKDGGVLRFEDAEDEDEKWDFDLAALYRGIAQTIQETDWDGDMDMIDAEVADCVFQYGLFDQLVYG